MVAEAALENPAIWEGGVAGSNQESLALEYIAVLRDGVHHADLNSVKQHLFTLLYAAAQVHVDLRERLHKARTLDDHAAVERARLVQQIGRAHV